MRPTFRTAGGHRRYKLAEKGSNNRRKQKIKVADIHSKIAAIRKDFVEKTTTYILRKYDYVCVEDLNVAGLMRNHKLARALADASMGSFAPALERKKKRFGKEILYVDRFFPSSKQCRKCGVKNQDLTLSDRTFKCVNQACGHTENRDVHAAKNIEQECLKGVPRAAGEFTPMEIWSIPVPSLKEGTRQTTVGGGKGTAHPTSNAIEPVGSARTRSEINLATEARMVYDQVWEG